jgi:hypothetical protein
MTQIRHSVWEWEKLVDKVKSPSGYGRPASSQVGVVVPQHFHLGRVGSLMAMSSVSSSAQRGHGMATSRSVSRSLALAKVSCRGQSELPLKLYSSRRNIHVFGLPLLRPKIGRAVDNRVRMWTVDSDLFESSGMPFPHQAVLGGVR